MTTIHVLLVHYIINRDINTTAIKSQIVFTVFIHRGPSSFWKKQIESRLIGVHEMLIK